MFVTLSNLEVQALLMFNLYNDCLLGLIFILTRGCLLRLYYHSFIISFFLYALAILVFF